MKSYRRLIVAVGVGAVLGLFCIIGAGKRLGVQGNELFLLATWFNRVLIGLVVGLAGDIKITDGWKNAAIRGAAIGFIVSFAFFLSTAFKDLPGFIAGIIYGFIADLVATKWG